MMYQLVTRTKKVERELKWFIQSRPIISKKLVKLQQDPRGTVGAHRLHGELQDKWSCELGYDSRMIYEIDNDRRELIIVAIGSHKIYK